MLLLLSEDPSASTSSPTDSPTAPQQAEASTTAYSLSAPTVKAASDASVQAAIGRARRVTRFLAGENLISKLFRFVCL